MYCIIRIICIILPVLCPRYRCVVTVTGTDTGSSVQHAYRTGRVCIPVPVCVCLYNKEHTVHRMNMDGCICVCCIWAVQYAAPAYVCAPDAHQSVKSEVWMYYRSVNAYYGILMGSGASRIMYNTYYVLYYTYYCIMYYATLRGGNSGRFTSI